MFQSCEYPTIDLAIRQAHESLVHALGEQPSTAIHWAFFQYQSLGKIFRRVDTPQISRQEVPLIHENDNEYQILIKNNLPGKVCEVVFGEGITDALSDFSHTGNERLVSSERYQEVSSRPIEDYLSQVRIDAYRFYLVIPKEIRLFGEALSIYREDLRSDFEKRRDLILPTIDQIRKYAWTNLIRED